MTYVPGRHNLLNALGAVAIGIELQVPLPDRAALAEFTGAERRFQVRGERRGVMVDDYGHHLTEISAVIAAACATGRRPLIGSSRTATRTRDLMSEFAHALSAADEIVLTDIYPAGEALIEHVTVEALAAAVRATSTCPLHVVHQLAEIPARVVDIVLEGRSRLSRPGPKHDRRRRSHPGSAREHRRGDNVTVKAPSERNFRRASAKGAKRRRFRPRLSLGVVRRVFSVLLLLFGVPEHRLCVYDAAASASTASAFTATSGCRAGKCRPSSRIFAAAASSG